MVRAIQYFAFAPGILLLLFIDAVLAAIVLSVGIEHMGKQDCEITAILASIYLCLMTIAMYPGRRSKAPIHPDLPAVSTE